MVIGLLGYGFYLKYTGRIVNSNQSEEKEQEPETTVVIAKEFDITEAKKLAAKYWNGMSFFDSSDVFEIIDDLKKYDLSCDTLKDNKDVKNVQEGIYQYENDGVTFNCEGSESIKYDDANKLYQEMFGLNKTFPKETLNRYCDAYIYDEKTNVFFNVIAVQTCTDIYASDYVEDTTVNKYKVTSAYIKDEILVIETTISVYENSKSTTPVSSENKVLNFVKDNNNYVLESIN